MLEIDAATHTGVDNVREVIIEGLSIAPVRNRYKVFLIDEVHMLSNSSFNALLKSIEEPPPHVVFMMATTELDKIPDTVLSRSQVYEFSTISSKTVAERLRYVADQEGITVPDDALLLLARAGEGSMRDSLSAFDQVRAFAGDTLTLDDVTSVLGLVGRDLVFDVLDAVAAEDAAAAFALVEAAIERGYDLRILCRELARAARDLLLVSVDAARLKDPDVAGESERPRLTAIGARYSREDLLRAFDAFTRAEFDVRQSDHPRFQLEMALVRLMHLRKLVPLAELLDGGGRPAVGAAVAQRARGRVAARAAAAAGPRQRRRPGQPPGTAVALGRGDAGGRRRRPRRQVRPPRPWATATRARERYLAAIKAGKPFFFNAVVAQAYRIEVDAGAHHLRVPGQPEGAAGAVRGEPRVADGAGRQHARPGGAGAGHRPWPRAERRQPDAGRRRRGAGRRRARRPDAGPPTTNCVRRRSPILACRRCSRSSRWNAPRSRRCR